MGEEPEYINEQELSIFINRSVSSLRNDRFLRRGIPYYKFGRSVRYNKQEARVFMEKHKIKTETI